MIMKSHKKEKKAIQAVTKRSRPRLLRASAREIKWKVIARLSSPQQWHADEPLKETTEAVKAARGHPSFSTPGRFRPHQLDGTGSWRPTRARRRWNTASVTSDSTIHYTSDRETWRYVALDDGYMMDEMVSASFWKKHKKPTREIQELAAAMTKCPFS